MRCRIAVFAAVLAFAGAARAEDPPFLIVNLQQLIDESDEGQEFVKKLQDEIAAKKEKVQAKVRELEARQKDLLDIQPVNRTDQWYEDVRDLFRNISELKAEEQYFIAKKNDEMARAITQLIQGAQTEARKIMRKRGALMVLITRTGPLQINDQNDLKDEILFRRVLVADPKASLDITKEVLEAMNKWFREHRAESDPNPRASKNGKKG